jgi:murein DD-endopeptidase MepM/ murein hydrolase activator NlpD
MAWTKQIDARRGFAVAMGLLACAMLAGCVDDGPYADDAYFPQATYYTVVVRPGDTISEIAHRYDASVSNVAELNRLGDESRIYPGQTLRVPAGGAGTREAVLGEASNSKTHNYAPPPRPIESGRFDPHNRVAVRNLAPPPGTGPQNQIADSDAGFLAPRQPDADMGSHTNGRFSWPVSGEVISSFGTLGRGERNDGINIAAPAGTPIRAAAGGKVTYTGNELKGYGNLVLIQHDDGYVTAYAHAQSISVNRGDRVAKGQVIGFAGATGDVDRPQLHFEIRKGVQPINPRLLLASRD